MVIRGEFDYGKYLASKNIYGSISSYSVKKIGNNKGNVFLKYIYAFRESVSEKIDKELPNENSGLLKGMIYGDTKDLDDNIKKTFENVGISHLTAVSGSNVATLIILFTVLFSNIKIKKGYIDVLILLVIITFCIISSLELSIVRATIMAAILLISRLLKKNISIYTILLITIMLILAVNPMAMFNVGLILSFIATLSIVMFAMPIKELINKVVKRLVKKDIWVKVMEVITVPMSVTISANILIFPIIIYSFGKFQGIFLVSNIIASYLETGIRTTGVIAIILMKIPILSTILFKISGLICSLLIYIAKVLEKVSMIIHFRQPTYIFLAMYYILVLCVYIKGEMVMGRGKEGIKEGEIDNVVIQKIYNLVRSIEIRLRVKSMEKMLLLILLIYIIVLKIYYIFFDNYIYFLNVGQGELAVIKTRDSFGVIDIGSTKNGIAASSLKSFMKNKNINEIDFIVISHMHSDHTNGVVEILQNYKVGCVIYSYPAERDNPEYLKVINCVREKGFRTIIVQSGDNISVGRYLDVNVLVAGQGKVVDGDMENANSIILEAVTGKKRLMFMGDATKTTEKILFGKSDKEGNGNKYDTEYNGIKIGHHGSKTSTSEELIKRFNFAFAVISAKKEEFGHPSKEVISILNQYRVRQYITEKEGAVKYSLN